MNDPSPLENRFLEESCVIEGISQAVKYLFRKRGLNHGWEAEVIWSPVITAQFVIVASLIGKPELLDGKRESVLKQFASSRLPNGMWGLL